MRRTLHALIAIASITSLVGASCGGDSDSTPPGPTEPPVVRPDSTKRFGWTESGGEEDDDDEGVVELGTIEVPIDYDDPSAGTFQLHVARHLATDPDHRLGSLLVNPGGPGFGGSEFALHAQHYYADDLLEHFDIVGWDPRGTGQSTPAIDCVDDYDKYFAGEDITPDDDAERQQIVDLAKEFETSCTSRSASIIQHVGTNDSARDMDAIRAALGEPKISYFGFSYGSELGATWLTMFPDTVRAAVLDGAVDPKADLDQSSLEQTKGFADSFTTFLDHCSDDDDCAFHSDGDAAGAFDALMKQLDDNPVPTEPGRPNANLQLLVAAAADALYDSAEWPMLEQALADARDGDGRGLLSLYDEYYQRNTDGTYPNTLEAFQTITCMDRPERPTVAQDDATAAQLRAISPRLSPSTVGSYGCTFYPPSTDPRITITGIGAGPVLVVGTTGDPATPLASSQAMADALQGGRLLTVVADQHTGYTANECSVQAVGNYLVHLTVPPAGSRCG